MKHRKMKLTVASAFVAAVPVFGAAVPALAATDAPARPAAPCGSKFDSVTVDGGLAAWTITCTNGTNAQISGWVKDTKADGKCAYIKAFANNGPSKVPLAKACPKGTVTNFNWRVAGASDIRAYLWTA